MPYLERLELKLDGNDDGEHPVIDGAFTPYPSRVQPAYDEPAALRCEISVAMKGRVKPTVA